MYTAIIKASTVVVIEGSIEAPLPDAVGVGRVLGKVLQTART
jgi:hypothetical protein